MFVLLLKLHLNGNPYLPLEKILLYLLFNVCLQLFCWFSKNGISTSLNLSLDSSPAYHLKVFTQENKNLFENFLSEKNGKMENKQKI